MLCFMAALHATGTDQTHGIRVLSAEERRTGHGILQKDITRMGGSQSPADQLHPARGQWRHGNARDAARLMF